MDHRGAMGSEAPPDELDEGRVGGEDYADCTCELDPARRHACPAHEPLAKASREELFREIERLRVKVRFAVATERGLVDKIYNRFMESFKVRQMQYFADTKRELSARIESRIKKAELRGYRLGGVRQFSGVGHASLVYCCADRYGPSTVRHAFAPLRGNGLADLLQKGLLWLPSTCPCGGQMVVANGVETAGTVEGGPRWRVIEEQSAPSE